MRLTLSQQTQNSLMYLNSASTRLSEIQNRAATGKRILKPSDDVPGTDRSLSLRTAISTLNQLSDNTVVSKPLLNITEGALGDLGDALRSARDIAVAAANSSLSSTAREAYAAQLDNILAEMADTANTRYMDQYIFSGTATDQPAIVQQAGPQPYAYNGDLGERRTQILSGIVIPLNISGDKVFNFTGAGGSTTDVFTAISQLREVVRYGTATAVSGELDNIDASLDNVLSCRARVGSWIARTERAQSIIEDTKIRLSELLSDQEDVDLAQMIVELKTQENVYQAALGVSSRILDMSLASLTFLK